MAREERPKATGRSICKPSVAGSPVKTERRRPRAGGEPGACASWSGGEVAQKESSHWCVKCCQHFRETRA